MKTIIKTILIVLIAIVGIQVNAQDTKTVVYECSFDCPSCEEKVMKNLPYEKGVKNVQVNYEQKLTTVTYKTSKNSDEGIKSALQKMGYEVEIKGEPQSFGVKGNCGMCKEKIEKAAMSVEGVTVANWNQEQKQLAVVFNSPANLEQIHQSVAASGYDTDKNKADDEVYSNLHSCCKYER